MATFKCTSCGHEKEGRCKPQKCPECEKDKGRWFNSLPRHTHVVIPIAPEDNEFISWPGILLKVFEKLRNEKVSESVSVYEPQALPSDTFREAMTRYARATGVEAEEDAGLSGIAVVLLILV